MHGVIYINPVRGVHDLHGSASLALESEILDRKPASRQFFQQQRHGGGYFALAGYDHGPLQVLAIRLGNNLPASKMKRSRRSNPDYGPVANQRGGGLRVRRRALDDEMIVSAYQDAQHRERRFAPFQRRAYLLADLARGGPVVAHPALEYSLAWLAKPARTGFSSMYPD